MSVRSRALLACAVIVGAGAVLGLALLRDDVQQACTQIGGTNGVSVALRDPEPDLRRAIMCVRGRCDALRGPRSVAAGYERVGQIDFPDDELGPGMLDVVLILDRRSRPAKVRTVRARLERNEPNGPGCGTWWRAATVFADDELRQISLTR